MTDLSKPEIASLVKRMKQKDKASFSIIYDKYSGPVFIYLCTVTTNQHAQQLLCNVFIDAFKNIHNYNECDNTFHCWLFKIAKQHAYNKAFW